jgi:hypothetical protein
MRTQIPGGLVQVATANDNQISIFHHRDLPDCFSNGSLQDMKRSIDRKLLNETL